ncbi:cobalamin-binding protein [Caenibacillus caldisaponilyticus]|uniref:cobalamin-binding protein n=1 Tax=Caenibacillus caldisaponilyticus TaxID=1674942 RepID=UPI0009885946|nr:cobalamin-binding protein [Caenibacillus caldisaponilyticus]
MRIASLCPSNTEICACLGLTEQLVGVDHYSDWPNEVRSLPDLGPDLQINMEKLAELKPNLIIASLSVPGMENNVEKLDQLGIPYIVLNPKRLVDIYEDILRVGEACDCYGNARRLVEDMKTRVEAVAERCPDPPDPPRLYWEWWPRPVFSPGRENWLTDVTRIVRAEHIFEEEPAPSVQSDWKAVRERRPDYVLLVWTGIPKEKVPISKVLKRPGWREAPFTAPDRLHVLDEGWYCRPSPRLVTGLEHLAHLLYPESCPEARSYLSSFSIRSQK